jgi:hypothetical protein
MIEKYELLTKSGKIEIKIDRNEEYPSICIKLDHNPIVMIEQSDFSDKLIFKKYPNKNVIADNNYINNKKYGIESDLSDETIKDILDSISSMEE